VALEGHDDARATHLVVGAERRTLKVVLAVANGAHLVRAQLLSFTHTHIRTHAHDTHTHTHTHTFIMRKPACVATAAVR